MAFLTLVVRAHIAVPNRYFVKTINTLWSTINGRGTMLGHDREVYVSVICLKSPQGLIDTVTIVTLSNSPLISIVKNPLLSIFAVDSSYIPTLSPL